MQCILGACVLLCSQLWAVTLAQGCPPERPGECSEYDTTYDNATEVLSFCSLNCEFDIDLCNYTQGCSDVGMTSWMAVNGSAQADQEEAFVCGRRSFSVLESSWVNFTATLTCLQFQFMRHLPYDLDVFIVPFNNVSEVQTLRNRSANEPEGIYSYNFTISQMVGKVLFRLYGGGGFSGNGSRRLLQLHNVSAIEGSCTTPVCSSQNIDEFCGWDFENWMVSPQDNYTVIATSSLTTTRQPVATTATGSVTTGDLHPSDSTTKQPVTTTGTTETTGSGVVSSVSTVSNGSTDESTEDTDNTEGTSESTQTPISEGRDYKEKDDDSANDGIIAGVVIAVIVVVAVIVIIVIIWRRKSRSSNTYSFGKNERNGSTMAMTETIKNSTNRYDTL